MQQCYPIGRQQRLQPGEEGSVMIDPHMLEHADRDDSVVMPEFLAIIAKIKPHAIGQPCRRGAADRHPVLFDGEGQTSDIDAALAGKVEGKAAPARADVENPVTRTRQQLCRNVALLVELSSVEAVAEIVKIGAGILAIL